MGRRTTVFVGSYADADETGIHVLDGTDPARPVLRGVVRGIVNPSFLAAHPTRDVLYAVSEVDDGELVALRADAAGGDGLAEIGRAPSHGDAPCHVAVAADARHVYAANYGSGSVVAYALEPDGGLGDLVAVHQHAGAGPTPRQRGPHAHCVRPGRGGVVHAADLGTDRVVTYAHGTGERHRGFAPVDELALAAGSGPRHLALHPQLPLAYLVGELDSTVTSLAVDPADGALSPLQTVATLPDGAVVTSTAAEVVVHPDGRHLYVSNRGHDSVAVFAIDERGGLEPVGHVPSGGATPRHLAVHPSGRTLLVANQDDDVVVPFAIDPSSGMPSPLEDAVEIPRPVCVLFAEVGR